MKMTEHGIEDSRDVAHEKGHDSLGKELRRRMAAVEGRVEGRVEAQGTGAGHAGAGPSRSESGASDAGRKPPSKPRVGREYPDLVTRETEEDDEEAFGETWPMIVEWQELKDVHPNDGKGPRLAGCGRASVGGGAGPARRPRHDASPGAVSAEGLRPQRAGQLAQDRALRHAESAEEAGASKQVEPRTLVAVAEPGVRRLAGNFSERFGGGLRKGGRRPSFAGLGPLIMSVLLGFFQGFRP